jgi:hypothetical protein
MKTVASLIAATLLAAGCSGGTDATTCAEYAADLRQVIASTTSADELEAFLDDTESDVAKLIIDSRGSPDARFCADAILEATFTIADRGFSQIGD